jgi:hypothetical protein
MKTYIINLFLLPALIIRSREQKDNSMKLKNSRLTSPAHGLIRGH